MYRREWEFFTDQSSVYEFDTLLGLRHFTLCPLFALRGKTTLGSPGVTHSLIHSSAAFAQVKANKRASQDRRHGRSWKKQRKIHEKPFRKRVASWQSFSFRKEASVSTSSHVWNFKWIALPWKHGACKHVQCWNMCVSSSLTSRTLFFDRRVRNAHELKLSWSLAWC